MQTVDAERVIVDALRAGRRVGWTVRGSSMWPAVRDGAVVDVDPSGLEGLRAGDLVAYERAGKVIVHRVVTVLPAGLRCRGDAVAVDDPFVPRTSVLGRATVRTQRALGLRVPRPREFGAVLRALRGAVRGAWRR